jgi:hypothetical protein
MNKLNTTLLITALTSAISSVSAIDVTGKYINETAIYSHEGQNIGDYENNGTEITHSQDNFKFDNTIKLFLDGEIASNPMHIELQTNLKKGYFDKSKEKSSLEYTQDDILREAYIDTESDGWAVRWGKQQVVWGTADGAKLLDVINPTDYTEIAQNQLEDSRIPVWMINAEIDTDSGANVQFILSEARENIFAGLNRDVDTNVRANAADGTDLTNGKALNQGNAFIMKGVDTITGKRNGFLNGVPDLGSIAAGFSANAAAFGGAAGDLRPFVNFRVGDYAQSSIATNPLGAGVNDGAQTLAGFASGYDFNLSDATSASDWSASDNPNSMFEYMDRTVFASFDAFVDARSQYVYDMPTDDAKDLNLAFRVKNSTDAGLNYSFNYSYNYDPNPVIELSWRNDAGEKLTVNYAGNAAAAAVGSDVLSLTDNAGNLYGGQGSSAILTFEQRLERVSNLGFSLDYALASKPVVLRGEFLYQNGVYSPIFNRGKLAIGDLVGALKMEKGDRFKYVLGVDVTVLTNLLVSTQFISDINLDYKDDNVDWDGTTCTVSDGANCGVYTADFSTMHMSNGFQKAQKIKNFMSLFLSKPFGASGEHRVNNILMYEDQETGGFWNRFDIEYSIADDMVATIESNEYFGDENTQFGQLEKASNVQVGLKVQF